MGIIIIPLSPRVLFVSVLFLSLFMGSVTDCLSRGIAKSPSRRNSGKGKAVVRDIWSRRYSRVPHSFFNTGSKPPRKGQLRAPAHRGTLVVMGGVDTVS